MDFDRFCAVLRNVVGLQSSHGEDVGFTRATGAGKTDFGGSLNAGHVLLGAVPIYPKISNHFSDVPEFNVFKFRQASVSLPAVADNTAMCR